MLLLILFGFGFEFIVVTGLMVAFIFREGKVNLSSRYSVYGKPAYAIGAILVSHAPLSLTILFLLDRAHFEFVRPGNGDLVPFAVLEIWLGLLLGCGLLCAMIALIFAEDDYWWMKPRKKRSVDEQRPRGRRLRHDEIEDLEEERERRPRKRRGEVDRGR